MLTQKRGVGMKSKERSKRIYCAFVKRCLDIVFSFVLLLFLSPLIFLLMVIIRSESEGGAIFKQRRVGRGGEVFVCYKLRTMYIHAPAHSTAAELCDREKYITHTGRFLRRTSLDELPQLYNVLKGNMSLIGPRPLICEEENIHRERMSKGVYALRPGITGMAQISGRNCQSDEQKLASDEYYLENVRLLLDVRILALTLIRVALGDGVIPEVGGADKALK